VDIDDAISNEHQRIIAISDRAIAGTRGLVYNTIQTNIQDRQKMKKW
jgi:hypothetical protein